MKDTKRFKLLTEELMNSEGDLQTLKNLPVDKNTVELFIQDPTQPVHLRLTCLDAYLLDGHYNQAMFDKLTRDSWKEIRQAIAYSVYHPPNPENPVIFDEAVLEVLIYDKHYDICSTAIKAARYLVKTNKLPIRFLTVANKHSYFLVRKYAIQYIANIDTPDMIELLYEFRSTSYHVSQQAIRDFVIRHLDVRDFTDEQIQLAIELIENLSNAKKVSEISKRKNEKLLSWLRGDTNAEIEKVKLFNILVNNFNITEIRVLCFELGINFDSLPQGNLETLAMELILHWQRHFETLEQLKAKVFEKRPFLAKE